MFLIYYCQVYYFSIKAPESNEQTDPTLSGELLSIRDLLSFAWQIAKGMSYLSENKVSTVNNLDAEVTAQ